MSVIVKMSHSGFTCFNVQSDKHIRLWLAKSRNCADISSECDVFKCWVKCYKLARLRICIELSHYLTLSIECDMRHKPWWGFSEEGEIAELRETVAWWFHLVERLKWETFKNWRNRETARVFRVNLTCVSDSSGVWMFQGVEVAKCAKMSRH